jgi:hypothetical protein
LLAPRIGDNAIKKLERGPAGQVRIPSMKLRIANIGVPATHSSIVTVQLPASTSLSDFDALIFDPVAVSAGLQNNQASCFLREAQVQELLDLKAGVVVAFVRPSQATVGTQSRAFNGYFLLDASLGGSQFTDSIRPGSGTRYDLAPTASSAGRKYFRSLDGHLQFEGHFSGADISTRGRVVATNSVGQVISVQFNARNGKVLFVPYPSEVGSERIGAAIFEAVNALMKDDPEVAEPEWAQAIVVPGSKVQDSRIAELKSRRRKLKEELDALEAERGSLRWFRNLLFGTGKSTLEAAVRSALRLIGFEVPEPEEYAGEWDVELRLSDGRTAIAEVEGAEGVVSVDKFRQLHHYLGEEELVGRGHKGILIGNGFRLQEPSSRPQQFSEHAASAASKFGICLLPTSELFKCVVAILEKPDNLALRGEIRESMFAAIGPWAFAPGPNPSAESATAADPLSDAESTISRT